MSKESMIIVLGDDTPDEVKREVSAYKEGAVLNFSWDDEDNEDMPITAKYLSYKYNVYSCSII